MTHRQFIPGITSLMIASVVHAADPGGITPKAYEEPIHDTDVSSACRRSVQAGRPHYKGPSAIVEQASSLLRCRDGTPGLLRSDGKDSG